MNRSSFWRGLLTGFILAAVLFFMSSDWTYYGFTVRKGWANQLIDTIRKPEPTPTPAPKKWFEW